MTSQQKIVHALLMTVSCSSAARASTITFSVSGTFLHGAALTGTMTVDNTRGIITEASFEFGAPEILDTRFIALSQVFHEAEDPFWGLYVQTSSTARLPQVIVDLPTGTLVGYEGGPLCSLTTVCGSGYVSDFERASGLNIPLQSGSASNGVVVPDGYAFCPAGDAGKGGNYQPRYQFCDSGATPRLGYVFCQDAGFYDPALDSCVNGVITPSTPPPGDLVCLPGNSGLGGFYDPSAGAACDQGAIVPPGYAYCPAGDYGAGGAYEPSAGAVCNQGVVVPSAYSFCAPGARGGGGLYHPTVDVCRQGSIGPLSPP